MSPNQLEGEQGAVENVGVLEVEAGCRASGDIGQREAARPGVAAEGAEEGEGEDDAHGARVYTTRISVSALRTSRAGRVRCPTRRRRARPRGTAGRDGCPPTSPRRRSGGPRAARC